MARRLPSTPPVLPGFTHVHLLGSGGFADVFLYEQNMPRRQVAVKVMLSEVVDDHVRDMFKAEANVMAQLSAHPSILTVYHASVSSDGRPYLVMEFCSSSLTERYRKQPIPVPEVLRIAIKVGSAIETAHRAGVLHRDIKPSNILTTAYGHPVLSDFGIATTLGESDTVEAIGMSIPWSAPEVLRDDTAGTIASEVWSFGATVYSLLAGRSPFEVAGGSNKSADLMARVAKAKVPPIGRPDVPASLERVLHRAMSRRPEDRPGAMIEIVRELQAVEMELGVNQTAVEVAVDDWALTTVTDSEDRTLIRAAATSVPAASDRRARRRAAARGGIAVESSPDTSMVSGPASRSTATKTGLGRTGVRSVTWAIVAVVVAVLAVGGVTTATLLDSASDDIPRVTDIAAVTTATSVEFSWDDPGLRPSDSYQITTSDQTSSIQSSPRFTVASMGEDRVCIVVAVNRDGKNGEESAEKCVDLS
ncbi:serine/threonine-protein kinase [Marisediminicola sp. LYQ134]|uniref:serine/threonine-protein kinase n=1 Tax=Marisediminicola sp. LYQ134 TaxID=3391061 RepID=UPI0039831C19